MLSTDTDLPGGEVVDVYQSLAVVEHALRELKSPLKTRPVFRWKSERVCAHRFLCVLSYGLTRWIELEGRSKGLKLTAEGALERLRRVNLDELGIPGTSARWWAVKELSVEERGVTDVLEVENLVADLPTGLA